MREGHVGGGLITADIQRADDHRALTHDLEDSLVDAVLLLFIGGMRLIQIQEFRAQQAHAFGAIFHGFAGGFFFTDIGSHFHPPPVRSAGFVLGAGFDDQQPGFLFLLEFFGSG